MPQYPPHEIKEIRKFFNLYVKFPKSRWKEIERAEKNDKEGNRIFEHLKEEFMEKYMPAPNADPHDVVANIYENKNLENALTKSAHQDEMI